MQIEEHGVYTRKCSKMMLQHWPNHRCIRLLESPEEIVLQSLIPGDTMAILRFRPNETVDNLSLQETI